VFSAIYRHVPGGVQRVRDYHVGSVRELADELAGLDEDALLVGNGAIRYGADFGGDHGMVELGGLGVAYPSAVDLVELAHPRALREEFVQPRELEPLYLRKADAELRWEGRASA
jgi:tRNA threonylcarbamoyladenosine biosynthesis protein TsaB